jgi:pyridoxal phosphate enzyme (YggS family)
LFKDRKEEIMRRVDEALRRGGRTDEVTLLAVSKTFPAEKITDAYAQGQRLFGENRIQEALKKREELKDYPDLEIQFIGHLQTNKVKYLKGNFSLIHSLDRVELLMEMEKHFKAENRVQNILVQVNVGEDPNKSGVSVAELPALLEAAAGCPHIYVQGLTMMPPFVDNPEGNRGLFAETTALADKMSFMFRGAPNIDMDVLSMGMSGDFEVAVEEGSTLIRIGTALFGERDYV